MSIRKRVARNRDGEIQLTIKITGVTDVFRFATGMLSMQTEFATAGRKALRSLREAMGRARYAELDDFLHGRHRMTRGPGPKVVWFVLRGGHVAHAVQGNAFTLHSRIQAACGRVGLARTRVTDADGIRRCAACLPHAERLEQTP